MSKEIKKLEAERQGILAKIQSLDNNKGQLMIRLAELQGIIKYLEGKGGKKDGN